MDTDQFSSLIATLNRVADAMDRHTESNVALFGLLMSAEPEEQAEVSAIPKTLED